MLVTTGQAIPERLAVAQVLLTLRRTLASGPELGGTASRSAFPRSQPPGVFTASPLARSRRNWYMTVFSLIPNSSANAFTEIGSVGASLR